MIFVLIQTKRIQNDGYPASAHKIVTSDGYILQLHRIGNATQSEINNVTRTPVLLMHGLLESGKHDFISQNKFLFHVFVLIFVSFFHLKQPTRGLRSVRSTR